MGVSPDWRRELGPLLQCHTVRGFWVESAIGGGQRNGGGVRRRQQQQAEYQRQVESEAEPQQVRVGWLYFEKTKAPCGISSDMVSPCDYLGLSSQEALCRPHHTGGL